MFNVCILPHVVLLLHNNYAITSQRNLYRVNLRSLITPCPCLIIFALYETFLRSNGERRKSGRGAKDWAFSINLFARERLFLPMIYGFSIDESLAPRAREYGEWVTCLYTCVSGINANTLGPYLDSYLEYRIKTSLLRFIVISPLPHCKFNQMYYSGNNKIQNRFNIFSTKIV